MPKGNLLLGTQLTDGAGRQLGKRGLRPCRNISGKTSSRAESSTHWPASELTSTPGNRWSCVVRSTLTFCLGLMAMKQPQGQRLGHRLGSARQTAEVGLDKQAQRQLWRLLGQSRWAGTRVCKTLVTVGQARYPSSEEQGVEANRNISSSAK